MDLEHPAIASSVAKVCAGNTFSAYVDANRHRWFATAQKDPAYGYDIRVVAAECDWDVI